jgi:hypothetical protein
MQWFRGERGAAESSNVHGERCAIALLNTQLYSEGHSFFDVVGHHVLQAPRDGKTWMQMIGRGRRVCSHVASRPHPPDRKVALHLYLTTFPAGVEIDPPDELSSADENRWSRRWLDRRSDVDDPEGFEANRDHLSWGGGEASSGWAPFFAAALQTIFRDSDDPAMAKLFTRKSFPPISADVETWCRALHSYLPVLEKMRSLQNAAADCLANAPRNEGWKPRTRRELMRVCESAPELERASEPSGRLPPVWAAFTTHMRIAARRAVQDRFARIFRGMDAPTLTTELGLGVDVSKVLRAAVDAVYEMTRFGVYRFDRSSAEALRSMSAELDEKDLRQLRRNAAALWAIEWADAGRLGEPAQALAATVKSSKKALPRALAVYAALVRPELFARWRWIHGK